MTVQIDPLLCITDDPEVTAGTGILYVDGQSVGNVAILDPAGEGRNICTFKPHSESATDTGQTQLGVQDRVIIEATCDAVTIENLELLFKEGATSVAGGFRIPLTTVRDETLHEVVFEHEIVCETCETVRIVLRRAFIEQPWALPFRRDGFTEFVLRFVALPDAAFPATPFGYVERLCPGGGS